MKGEYMKSTAIIFKMFEIKTKKPQSFLREIESICKKYAVKKDYIFSYDLDEEVDDGHLE
jgi:hypothetical protein